MAAYANTDAFIANMQSSSSAMEAITWAGPSSSSAVASSAPTVLGSVSPMTGAMSGITGILGGIQSLWSAISARKVYALYKEQEKRLIETAMKQAERTELKGRIELRNLKVAQAAKRGKNIVGVAGAGGNLSGSFLDLATTNYKYNMQDQRTVSLNTLWETSEIKRSGYIKAYEVAGQQAGMAYNKASEAIQQVSKNLGLIGKMVADDYKAAVQTYNQEQQIKRQYEYNRAYLVEQAGSLLPTNLQLHDDSDTQFGSLYFNR